MKGLSFRILTLLMLISFSAVSGRAEGGVDEEKEAKAQRHFMLGEQYRSSSLFEKAAEEYRKVLEIYPENTDAYARLGYVLTENGEYDKAAEILRQLIEREPEGCTAYESLGYVFLKQAHGMGDALTPEKKAVLEEAIEAYLLGVESCPDNPDMHFSLARAYRAAERNEEAVESLRKVTTLDPKNASAYESIAEIRTQDRSYEEAIQAYETLLSLSHGKSPEWVRWAEARVAAMYRRLDNCAKAIPYYERVAAGDPNDTQALEGLAICYEKTGADELAVDAFENLLRLKPDKASYHYRLGQLLHDLGKYRNAVARVKKGLTYEMDCSAYAHYLLGESYEKLGAYPTAKREFERSRDCNDPVFREKAIAQIGRQEQLIKIQELEEKKREQGG